MSIFIFLASLVTAMAVENPMFARALGTSREALFVDGARTSLLLGATLTWMALFSSLFVALTNYLMLGASGGISSFRPVFYFAGVATVYVLTTKVLLVKLKFGDLNGKLIDIAPLATFNTALFGAFFISNSQNFGTAQTIGYALAIGAGYTAALLTIYYARVRLSLSPVPRAFRGLPVLLVYMGLISLALYGLIGRILPT